ncbi:hypothetical protein DD237_003883 [Peronospora effusa]|uniref:PDZ domain-containing protein n=1 Tax=Peronospora effusa TaxID=542832 RepID=A0A3R7XXL6_9STRA|nr:hypothetical protein DD237_003883 [Peronospora effusa]
MEYEVMWGDGPLGLTLRPDLGEDMPPVVGRITRQDSAAAMAKVSVGHMLVSINGMDTARKGYDHVVETLQKIPRPATLRFRVPRAMTGGLNAYRDSSRSAARRSRGSTGTSWSDSGKSSPSTSSTARRREQYTVVWTEGPLGMILRPDDDDCHVPCIRKITGKGAGTGMERATVGDILVAVNGQETKALGFRSTISLLKTIRKPAVLKFKRMGRRISRKRLSKEASLGSRSVSGIPSDTGSYDIVWREGDLGLKLKPGYRDVPVLSKLTGKGNASGLQNAQVGDELVSVNGTHVEGEAYQDTLRMLKHSPKPAVLRFRPGKSRPDSMMSAVSVSSVRSNPSTQREVTKVTSRQHVPLYHGSSSPPEPGGLSHPTKSSRHDRERSDRERSNRDRSNRERPDHERQRRKKRIPLDVARELVAASQGSDLEHAIFAGIPITAIEDGSKEAHLLRVQAKLCIANKAKADRSTPAKEALSRAEQEAKVLQEALEKVKSQAKKYEEILEAQSRERVLAMAVQHKPQEVVKRQNNVISELAGVISGFKRDSYTDIDIVPPVIEEDEHVQKIMDDLHNVMSIPVVVPTAKFCAECGTTENESKLDMDGDGEYYCKDCWDKFLNLSGSSPADPSTAEASMVPVAEPELPAIVEELPVVTAPSIPVDVEDEVSPSLLDAPLRSSRVAIEDREAEEQKARVEAEHKLMEIKELRRSGTFVPERQLHKSNADRSRRERRGLEELAQALFEEEERARAEGNLGLAKKLSAQRARTMAETSGDSPMTPFSSMGNLLVTNDAESRNRHDSPTKSKLASPVQVDSSLKLSRSVSEDLSLPSQIPVSDSPPISLEPTLSPVAAVTAADILHEEANAGDTPREEATAAVVEATAAVVEATATKAATVAETAAAVAVDTPGSPTTSADAGNDYADVNSDEEAEDQMQMNDEEDVLREVEEKNFALARQLDEAHSVIERARMSISMSGDDDDDEVTDDGLSEEQISLFKKLTSQADERMSMVDRLHPQDDSDSDSNSDSNSNSNSEEEEEEEEDEDVTAAGGAAAPAQESLMDRLWPVLRMVCIYYAITSFMSMFVPKPPHHVHSDVQDVDVQNADNPNSGPSQLQLLTNSFHLSDAINLRVYVTPDQHFSFADDAVEKEQETLRWFQDALTYDATPNPKREDGVWACHMNITVDDHLLTNGSLYAHVFVTKDGYSPNPMDSTYDAMSSIHRSIELTTFRSPPKTVKKRNLLKMKEEKEPEQQQSDTDAYITMWKPSFYVNVVLDHTTYSTHQPPPLFVSTETDMDKEAGLYSPVLFLNDFWLLEEHLIPINDTLTTLPLDISFYPLPMYKYALYTQMEQNFRNQEATGASSKRETDNMKSIFIETNPYLLAVTVMVSLLHSLFDFLAFKNDISFWKNQKSLVGLSLRSIALNTFFQLVIFLYLMDNDTSWLILVQSGIGLVIEVWKIKKALVVSRDANNRLVVSGVESYEDSPTAEHDRVAVAHLSYVLYPLIIGQAVYTLMYGVHKSWYSWVVSSLTSFVYAFGFIMMTPQLYINYKLKSVAHLPWRAMVYKSLNTFIDDLFAFVIKMPWMHRLSCFRDDLIFFIYLYQRWKYPVDAKRTNEFGQGPVEDEDVSNAIEGAARSANGNPELITDATPESVAAAVDETEEVPPPPSTPPSTEYLMSKRANTLEETARLAE